MSQTWQCPAFKLQGQLDILKCLRSRRSHVFFSLWRLQKVALETKGLCATSERHSKCVTIFVQSMDLETNLLRILLCNFGKQNSLTWLAQAPFDYCFHLASTVRLVHRWLNLRGIQQLELPVGMQTETGWKGRGLCCLLCFYLRTFSEGAACPALLCPLCPWHI